MGDTGLESTTGPSPFGGLLQAVGKDEHRRVMAGTVLTRPFRTEPLPLLLE